MFSPVDDHRQFGQNRWVVIRGIDALDYRGFSRKSIWKVRVFLKDKFAKKKIKNATKDKIALANMKSHMSVTQQQQMTKNGQTSLERLIDIDRKSRYQN